MIKIKISAELLTQALTTGYQTSHIMKVTNGLPSNCKLHLAEVTTEILGNGKEIKTLELIFDDDKEEITERTIEVTDYREALKKEETPRVNGMKP